ncbi:MULTISPECIES: hypothetical protein [unclassified Gordonia (in: high G+C Gram-positive bacteria)]|uniref:hypothetical protein n=1 Tax=unclassified Gordonia (in: high G+C Gram-positive bacteria) TaxID=2657482 RepID=UPI0007EAED13|nr:MULTISPECIES: hypothetical protein [unclassified Gordonia (in: high G+C Gram-positive bacteria)]OBC08613.1 hypothetical protein A5785_00170 [Gordonia sp. 852002-50395_SCH5434458]OBC10357.1 hypothetical protein A5786_05345 [Gordonia sp. 852002-50816_SCH5313054-a]OBC20310.1 hypothetical protein A5788_06565 [Gordonia sp. 852002-50816_SCH5313054-c]
MAVNYPATRSFIVRAGLLVPSPQFATPGWLDLDPADPRWRSSIARAALAWAYETHTLAETLADQLRADDKLARQRLREMSHDLSAATSWASKAKVIRDRAEFDREHPDLRRRPAC